MKSTISSTTLSAWTSKVSQQVKSEQESSGMNLLLFFMFLIETKGKYARGSEKNVKWNGKRNYWDYGCNFSSILKKTPCSLDSIQEVKLIISGLKGKYRGDLFILLRMSDLINVENVVEHD